MVGNSITRAHALFCALMMIWNLVDNLTRSLGTRITSPWYVPKLYTQLCVFVLYKLAARSLQTFDTVRRRHTRMDDDTSVSWLHTTKAAQIIGARRWFFFGTDNTEHWSYAHAAHRRAAAVAYQLICSWRSFRKNMTTCQYRS